MQPRGVKIHFVRYRQWYYFAAALCYTLTFPAKVASAATFTSNVAINALVPAAREIAAGGLAFGTYAGKRQDATRTFLINCTRTTLWNIRSNAGLAPGATVTTRKPRNGASMMDYAPFSDTLRTVSWGETAGVDTVAGIGTGSAKLMMVYGRFPPGQFVKPGAYADTVVATITD
jgi:spore coat protein U-like protein